MTLVISWIKHTPPSPIPQIWAISDGKIMKDEKSTLTLEGTKILEIPVKITHLAGLPPREIYYRSSIGFAYAGSSLVGLNTFATLSDIFNNLGGDKNKNDLPSYIDITEKAKIVLKRYSVEILSGCEICLFGFCPKTKQPFISRISTKLPFTPDMNLDTETIYGNVSHLKYILLGDKKEEIITGINTSTVYKQPTESGHWKIPLAAFYIVLKSKEYQTIGGGAQLAIAYTNEFQITALVDREKDDTTKATVVHKNMDIFKDIGIIVGDCKWAINIMDIGLQNFPNI